jgi:hypothetical protein
MTIKKLVDQVADSDVALYKSLLVAKVFGVRLKNPHLIKWIDKEINGYSKEEVSEIPIYRQVKVITTCNITEGWGTEYNTPFPITLLQEKDRRAFIASVELTGIVALEARLKSLYNGDSFGKSLDVHTSSILDKEIKKQAPNLTISNVRISVPFTEVELVLSGARNKLLDLLLKIESEFPEVTDVAAATAEKKEEVSHYITNNFFAHGSSPAFDSTNIATSGEANSITAVIGDNSTNLTNTDGTK